MIFVRHGQSAWNVVYARTRIDDPNFPDAKLTDEGRRQAAEAAGHLQGRGLRRLLASPYSRALETAHIIADRLGGLPIGVEPLVREHGRFQCDVGSRRTLLSERWPALDFAHLEEEWWPAGLDESDANLADRSRSFRARMAAEPDWSEVAVVSHWGFIRHLTGFELRNCGLVTYDPVRGHGKLLTPEPTG